MAMKLMLREALPEDRAFMLQVYASTRADELAQTGWDAATCAKFVAAQFEAQWTHYQAHFAQAELFVIVWSDEQQVAQPVGRLWIDRRAAAIHVLDIALLTHFRGRGLGTACLQNLMAEAADKQLPLTIKVEVFNPARHLYERLGFVAEGEHGVHIAMAWRALDVNVKEIENEQA
jgi:ribosomal protein S18 acetylase RimI-like enzyme